MSLVPHLKALRAVSVVVNRQTTPSSFPSLFHRLSTWTAEAPVFWCVFIPVGLGIEKHLKKESIPNLHFERNHFKICRHIYQTAVQNWSQNILIGPWWLAAVKVINPSPSILIASHFDMDQTNTSMYKSNKFFSYTVSFEVVFITLMSAQVFIFLLRLVLISYLML